LSLALVACEDEVPDLSTGKNPIDITMQTDMVDFTDDSLYNRKIIIKRSANPIDIRNARFDLNVLETIPKLGYEIVEAPPGVDVLEFIEEMRASGDFDIVEPNVEVSLNPPLEDEETAPDQEDDLIEEGEEKNDSGKND
jgi:hypothetical protein